MKHTAAICIVILACSVAAGQSLPVGPDFQVAYLGISVYSTSVAVTDDGQFLAAWCRYFSLDCGVLAFSRDGSLLGGTSLDESGLSSERPIAVTPFGQGYFLAREEGDGVNGERRITGHLFLADGTPDVTPFEVTSSADVYPLSPRVAVGSISPLVGLGPAYLVVVWSDTSSEGDDTSGRSIQARYFDASGHPYGFRFQVNASTLGDQELPDVVVAPDDEIIVVWQSASSAGTDSSGRSIQMQRFPGGETPYGPDIQVNSHTPLDQSQPRVAVGSNGSFVVSWTSGSSAGDDTDSTSVQARRFLASGTPAGPDFQVNTYSTGYQRRPVVGIRDDGGFEVAWESYGSPGEDQSATSIQRRELKADLTPIGEQTQVNTTTYLGQDNPDLAMNAQGDFVVVWGSFEYQMRGRIFRTLLFGDDFESGDTSAWSETVP